jgi:hypothetical protein
MVASAASRQTPVCAAFPSASRLSWHSDVPPLRWHHSWRVRRARPFDLAADNPTAAKQIRKMLVKGGIKIVRNRFDIFGRCGDKRRCVFVLDLGAPGVA